MSETERKRAEAQAARERLIGTVNELGTAIQDTKRRARERAQCRRAVRRRRHRRCSRC